MAIERLVFYKPTFWGVVMRWVHKVRVMMLAKESDVLADVAAAVKEFAGVEPRVEQVEESPNRVVTADVLKESQQNDLLKRLMGGLGAQVKDVIAQTGSRLHEEEGEWNFYVRLEKAAYINDRRMVLTDSGNCLHVKLTLAVFPKKEDAARALVGKLFVQAKKSI